MFLEATIDLLFGVIGKGVDGLLERSARFFEDSEKVDDALRELRKSEFVEILLCAVWHDGVLNETERARVLAELQRVEASELAALLEHAPSTTVDGRGDDVLEAHVRALAEGFSSDQRAYALAAVERVLRAEPSPEAPPDHSAPYRRAACRPTDLTLALFRRALSAP